MQKGDIVRFKSIRYTPLEWDHWAYGVLLDGRSPKGLSGTKLHWEGYLLGPAEIFPCERGYSYCEEDIKLVPEDEVPDWAWAELAKWKLTDAGR